MSRIAYRDENWDPEPVEPLWIEWSEVPGRGTETRWGTSDQWRCREHPDWHGEDITKRDLATWERLGVYADEQGGPQGMYEREALEVHAALHDIVIAAQKRPSTT
jgi:hypothetical protein